MYSWCLYDANNRLLIIMQTYYITCIYTKYSRIIKRRESGVFSGRKLQNDNICNSNIATTSEIVIIVVANNNNNNSYKMYEISLNYCRLTLIKKFYASPKSWNIQLKWKVKEKNIRSRKCKRYCVLQIYNNINDNNNKST